MASVNQVIGEDIQQHFTGRKPAKRKAKAIDPNAVINEALAGGIELNARLTQLEQGFDASRAEMHLEPPNLRRVVDTALRLDHQLPLVPVEYDADDPQGVNADVFSIRPFSAPWQATMKGLYTRLLPDVPRPITFDQRSPRAAATSSTCTSVTRSCRRRSGCCAAPCGARPRR